MSRTFLLTLASSVVFTVSGQQTPIYRARTDAVSVSVSVKDGKRLAAGLTLKDFRLTDEGVPQAIAEITQDVTPLDLTLLVDVSNSMGDRSLPYFHKVDTSGRKWLVEAIQTLTELLTRHDRLQVTAVASRIRMVPLADLARSLAPPGKDEKAGHTSLFDAVLTSLMPEAEPGRRRLVVALTDGRDTTSIVSSELRAAIADRSDSAMSFVLLGTRGPSADVRNHLGCSTQMFGVSDTVEIHRPCGDYDWVFQDIASRTGGLVAYSTTQNDFRDRLSSVLDEFRHSYLLTYIPTGVRMSGWHALSVTVPRHPQFSVLARRGYWRD